jgi:hypothetical protein
VRLSRDPKGSNEPGAPSWARSRYCMDRPGVAGAEALNLREHAGESTRLQRTDSPTVITPILQRDPTSQPMGIPSTHLASAECR